MKIESIQRGVAIIAAGLSLGIVASEAYAHGGDTSLVHGCIKPDKDAYIVAASANCTSGWTSKHWSIAGPKGLKGDKGATGLTGAVGPQGLVGPAGTAGAQGPAGINGADGTIGPQGPQGHSGKDNVLMVYDAAGVELGRYAYRGGGDVTYRTTYSCPSEEFPSCADVTEEDRISSIKKFSGQVEILMNLDIGLTRLWFNVDNEPIFFSDQKDSRCPDNTLLRGPNSLFHQLLHVSDVGWVLVRANANAVYLLTSGSFVQACFPYEPYDVSQLPFDLNNIAMPLKLGIK